ncbi:hypothetical protein EIN_148330 [Entamoeba invadens IP1]|uniref:DNA-directed DNA polymerase n=1 Tax=Entamoeba invadens IP1 TaxID=370355 RepID=L7FKK5_ENTIV|nr:hypothetical protein EIN_148330 [Entamoeba invadens IP1]ELP85531.1 hypothetical protein EIN_148330 [Entamoeba invadens IP1]|eukprot:XP_004184877.1 hypothetical protein EIN_148330 [Entamoeba invadens IP1]
MLLRDFPKTFNLDVGIKKAFPYNFYYKIYIKLSYKKNMQNFIVNKISIFSKYVFYKNIYSKVVNLYYYSSNVGDFLRGAIYGGRCMCKDNKMQQVKDKIYDLDFCSLYPSAMKRLYLVEGLPMVMTDNQLNLKYLLEHSIGYVWTGKRNPIIRDVIENLYQLRCEYKGSPIEYVI